MKSLKEQYVSYLCDKITTSKDDISPNELNLINHSFELFKEKMEDIKILNDEIKRLTIELLNLKSMNDNSDNEYDELH